MIRNLVFDFGNVLVDWRPERHLVDYVGSEEEALMWRKRIWCAYWGEGDRGMVTREQITEYLVGLYPEQEAMLREVTAIEQEWLVMLPDTEEFLEKLRAAGYRLYYLSNTSAPDYASMMRRLPALSKLDGGIASFQEKLLKPDPAIFTTLLSRFGLDPEESLFMDDALKNLDGAASVGMKTLHVPNIESLRANLTAYLAAEAGK